MKNLHCIISTIIASTALFYVIFSPPFLSWDSYHYMVLSFYPEAGASHPLLFGFILRLISVIAQPLWDNAFTHLYTMFNVFCFLFILWLGFKEVNKNTLSLPKQFILGIISIVVMVVIIPAMFGLINVFWSEMTGFFLVMLTGLFVAREYRKHSYFNLFFITVGCVLAYHTRYHLIILPVAVISWGIILYVRRISTVNYWFPAKWVTVGFLALFAIFLSNSVIRCLLPSSSTAGFINAENFLKNSIQCTLRCDVSLFEKDCNTAKEIILKKSSCLDIAFGALGAPKASEQSVFKEMGFLNTIRWLVKAPTITLFQDHIGTEIGGEYVFNKNMVYLSQYREVMDYYGGLITVEEKFKSGSGGFNKLIRWINYLYFELSAYHLLSMMIIFASLVIIWVSPNPIAIFLALVCIGNWLIFSYINPLAPVRYLMQFLVPGMTALVISITYAMKFRIKEGG